MSERKRKRIKIEEEAMPPIKEESDLEKGIYDAVVKLANDVYNEMGPGHIESVYHKSMEHGLREMGYKIESEVVIPFYYKNQYVGFGRSDIIINRCDEGSNDRIILEFKAIGGYFRYCDICKLKQYMKHLNIKNGMMINFPQYKTNTCLFKFV